MWLRLLEPWQEVSQSVVDAFQQSSCEPDVCLIIMFDQERLMDDGYCHHNILQNVGVAFISV